MDIKPNNVLLSQSLVREACSPAGLCAGINVYYSGLHRAMGAWSSRGCQSLQQVGAPLAPGGAGEAGEVRCHRDGEGAPAQPQLLTSQQGRSCRDSVQVHPDTVPRGRAGAPGCLGGMSAQRGRECLEKLRETVISSRETPHLPPARAQRPSDLPHVSEVGLGCVTHGAWDTPRALTAQS